MKYLLLFVGGLFVCTVQAQYACPKTTPLFTFNSSSHPIPATRALGDYPQFNFLQVTQGVTTVAAFYRVVKDPAIQKRNQRTFREFNRLLRDIGLAGGVADLEQGHISDTFVAYGTTGNLGYYNKDKDKRYFKFVTLNPAGEPREGVRAWKVSRTKDCYFYILKACGNAFYPNQPPPPDTPCCLNVAVKLNDTAIVLQPQPVIRMLRIKVNHYDGIIRGCLVTPKMAQQQQGKAGAGRSRFKPVDTLYVAGCPTETVVALSSVEAKQYTIHSLPDAKQVRICQDTVIYMDTKLVVDSTVTGTNQEQVISFADTCYRIDCCSCVCREKWELYIGGGFLFNSVPRYDNTSLHTRTNGGQFTAQLSIGRFVNSWLLVGLSASYMTLAYQDDIAYPGTVPGIYNTVTIGKPVIPVQLFGEAIIGRHNRWQSTFALSAGAAFASGAKIENNGVELTTRPDPGTGFTAGLKMGVGYNFSSRLGLGVSFTGQYVGNKITDDHHHLFALPILLGVKYRW